MSEMFVANGLQVKKLIVEVKNHARWSLPITLLFMAGCYQTCNNIIIYRKMKPREMTSCKLFEIKLKSYNEKSLRKRELCEWQLICFNKKDHPLLLQ